MRSRRSAPPSYELISLVLDYPAAALDEHLARSEAQSRAGLDPFFAWWRATPLSERERRYVETFDLDRHSTLHLTYYLHGDTRKRGLALLRLKRLYAAGGLPLDTAELEAMYRLLAIAKYEDRYVIPKAHAEHAQILEAQNAGCSVPGGPGGGYGEVGYPPQRGPTGRRLNVLRDGK